MHRNARFQENGQCTAYRTSNSVVRIFRIEFTATHESLKESLFSFYARAGGPVLDALYFALKLRKSKFFIICLIFFYKKVP